jgi:hypothetical protein
MTMRILFARLLYALLAATALAASVGVSAPPHRVPDGTPLVHNLVLGAYRFGFLVEPARSDAPMTPEMAALHRALALAGIPMTEMPGMAQWPANESGPIIATSGLNPAQELALEFALLVMFVPRLARPTRRVVADLAALPVAARQWWTPVSTAPPRALVLA